MGKVILLDSSVYRILLGMDETNPHYASIWERMISYGTPESRNENRLVLPIGTIIETGNYIARLPNGNIRYRLAQKFVTNVERAINGKAPYRAEPFPDDVEFLQWIADFPISAQADIALVDHTIIKQKERIEQRERKKKTNRKVEIWSIDEHLSAYGGTDHAGG
jgi:hypothetical protein